MVHHAKLNEVFDGHAGDARHRYRWQHFKRSAATERYLLALGDVPDEIAWALVEEDTMPCVVSDADGGDGDDGDGATAIFLRGINETPGDEPEDMISLRLLVIEGRILSIELRRLPVVDRLVREFCSGQAPASIGDFVIHVVETLREQVEHELDTLERDILDLELASARASGDLSASERAKLADTRQDAILIRRFVAPQAGALDRLVALAPRWLEEPGALRVEADAFRRIAGDLGSILSRGQIVADELRAAQAERSNRVIMILSAVSVVFLPLTFLTGLLGVNLAGIPHAEDAWSFPAFAVLLTAVAVAAAWVAVRLLR
ncbi:MAG: CorA family divalent cation transporter [Pseudomonadota bacterium]